MSGPGRTSPRMCCWGELFLSLWSESLGLGLLCLGFLKFFFGYFDLYMRLRIFLIFYLFINQALETWFLGGHHVRKNATSDVIRPWKLSLWDSILAHHTWLDHGNWVFETRFIGQNRVLQTRDASKSYSFRTGLLNI